MPVVWTSAWLAEIHVRLGRLMADKVGAEGRYANACVPAMWLCRGIASRAFTAVARPPFTNESGTPEQFRTWYSLRSAWGSRCTWDLLPPR